MTMNVRAIYGDFYHAAAPYAQSLKQALEGTDAQLEGFSYPPVFDPAVLQGCDVFVLCKEGVVPGSPDIDNRWMDRAGEEAVERFVAGGGKLFGWHSGLASYDPEGPIHAMYGGRFHGHPPQHAFELRATGVQSPLVPDGLPVTMTDELYRMSVTPETASIWLEGHSEEGGTQPVGWSNPHGKGSVVCLSIAHERSNLTHPGTQAMLRDIVVG
jgi:type 1 glutamine amidotransferase